MFLQRCNNKTRLNSPLKETRNFKQKSSFSFHFNKYPQHRAWLNASLVWNRERGGEKKKRSFQKSIADTLLVRTFPAARTHHRFRALSSRSLNLIPRIVIRRTNHFFVRVILERSMNFSNRSKLFIWFL